MDSLGWNKIGNMPYDAESLFSVDLKIREVDN